MPLSKCPRPAVLEAAALVRDIASAMAAAHQEGVIHRDLKPSHIIITPDGAPVVVDFGLALLLEDELTRLTQPGERLGTAGYMSPEQLLGAVDEIGPRSDIYSLGCVLYKLLTGQCPFEGSVARLIAGPESMLHAPRCWNDQPGLAVSSGNLGRLNLDWGYLDQAESCFLEDLSIARNTHDERGEALMHDGLGRIALERGYRDATAGRPSEARQHWVGAAG